jgi:hypothetical protein
MIDMIYVIVLLVTISVAIFAYDLRIQEEVILRTNDQKLGEYYFQSRYHRNDGWTMMHYKNLYKERLKELKSKARND